MVIHSTSSVIHLPIIAVRTGTFSLKTIYQNKEVLNINTSTFKIQFENNKMQRRKQLNVNFHQKISRRFSYYSLRFFKIPQQNRERNRRHNPSNPSVVCICIPSLYTIFILPILLRCFKQS